MNTLIKIMFLKISVNFLNLSRLCIVDNPVFGVSF